MTKTTTAKGKMTGKAGHKAPTSARTARPKNKTAAAPQPALGADVPVSPEKVEAPLAIFPPPRETKGRKLRWQLEVPGGATLSSLMALTGWQAHTIRAVLSGLRKKGWVITRRREGNETIYAIDVEASVVKEEIDDFEVIEDEPATPERQADSPRSASAPDVSE